MSPPLLNPLSDKSGKTSRFRICAVPLNDLYVADTVVRISAERPTSLASAVIQQSIRDRHNRAWATTTRVQDFVFGSAVPLIEFLDPARMCVLERVDRLIPVPNNGELCSVGEHVDHSLLRNVQVLILVDQNHLELA